MKKIIIPLVVVVVATVGGYFAFKTSDSNQKPTLPVALKNIPPVSVSVGEFQENCLQGRYGSLTCDNTFAQKLGCVPGDKYSKGAWIQIINITSSKYKLYSCASGKEDIYTGLVTSGINFVYLSEVNDKVTAFYNWNDFFSQNTFLVTSEKEASRQAILAGFSWQYDNPENAVYERPDPAVVIKKTSEGYELSGGLYYNVGEWQCMNRCFESFGKEGNYERHYVSVLIGKNGSVDIKTDNNVKSIRCSCVPE